MAQPEFAAAVAGVAATLAIKTCTLHLATARARLKYNDTKHAAIEWKADRDTHPAVKAAFRACMLTQLPSWSVAALEQCVKNASENEPLFLCLALAASAAGPVAPWAAGAVRLFGASRCVHAVVMLHDGLPQPVRAVCYLAGVGATFALALAVLLGGKD
jgi:uncharacterized MAPEG superfamily protein